MARKSFTLQKVTPDYGSYLSYPSGSTGASVGPGLDQDGNTTLENRVLYIGSAPGAASSSLVYREDDDTRLKSDGILLAPILNNPTRSGALLPYISFFEAEVSDYNEVILSWDAPLNDLNLVEGLDTVVATGVLIVYSDEGEPQTISDGSLLVNDNSSQLYYHQVPSGKWAYYTLFVKFESKNGDLYYEPSAKLAVLTPNRYNSIDELYVRVPEYYRLRDGEMDEGVGGPLYRYLSIFGYEIDRIRTIIDHMMVMKDPQIANSQVLDYISQDLGIGVRVHELGTARLRTLINIIGFLRRSEGTKSSLELAVQALTGSDVEIDTANQEVKVYAQRVNLLKDPDLQVLVVGLFDGGLPSTTTYNFEVDAGVPSTTVVTDTYEGGTPTVTGGTVIDETQDPIWAYDPDLESGGSAYILRSTSAYIMVKTGDILYYSMQEDATSGIQDKIHEVKLLYDNGSELITVASTTDPIVVAGIYYFKLEVVDGYEDYTATYIHVHTDSDIDATISFGKMLLERAIGGSYFDGYTSLGGWLVDSDTISDYRWYDPDDSDSSVDLNRTDTFSVYNSNYSKTRAVVHRMLTSYLPVTELTTGMAPVYYGAPIPNQKWTVTFNHIPGVPYGTL